MSYTAPPPNWLDLPRSENSIPAHEPIPSDLQEALERFADTIAGVKASQTPSIAHYLSTDPGRARFNTIAQQLPDPYLTGLLNRMTAGGGAPSTTALPEPAIAAIARKSLLSRILDRTRIEALQRACETVSAPTSQGSLR